MYVPNPALNPNPIPNPILPGGHVSSISSQKGCGEMSDAAYREVSIKNAPKPQPDSLHATVFIPPYGRYGSVDYAPEEGKVFAKGFIQNVAGQFVQECFKVHPL